MTSSVPGAEPGPAPGAGTPFSDLVAEARRLVEAARAEELTVRVLGGAAVYMQSPNQQPLLPRELKDIDLVTPRGEGKRIARMLGEHGYAGEDMFNAVRGSRRQLFHDPVNGRQLDVFVGGFEMCHSLPIADRLERDPYTVPLAELVLTKLQIVELNERDERDIYTLFFHHEIGPEGIEPEVIATVCAADWGLWRTCRGTIERSCADIDHYGLDGLAQELVLRRLARLSAEIDAAPKTGRWKRRSRVGERMRWYQEPEEV